MKYVAGILVVLIYLPIFLLSIKRDFRKRFSEINSKKFWDLAVEFVVGILYFLVIVFSFFSELGTGVLFFMGTLIYFIGLVLTCRGYYVFNENSGLIIKDVFSVSRNPTYVFGFVAIFGVAIMTRSLCVFGLLLLTMILTNRIMVNEEKFLEKKFGKKYLEYKGKVGRWI